MSGGIEILLGHQNALCRLASLSVKQTRDTFEELLVDGLSVCLRDEHGDAGAWKRACDCL
jgi:hypothetical protein